MFKGKLITSLDTERMASNDLYAPVPFGFLENLRRVIGGNPRPDQP